MGDILVWLGVLVLALLVITALVGGGSTAAPAPQPGVAATPTPVIRVPANTATPIVVVSAPAAAVAAPASLPAGTTLYTVQRGDTLYRIAVRFGTTLQAILAANPSITNPDVIHPGDQLVIPAVAR